MVVFGRSVAELWRVRAAMEVALGELRLRAHRRKTQVLPTSQGVPWVGFRVFPGNVQLPAGMVARVRRRFRAFASRQAPGQQEAVHASIAAWHGHGRRGASPGLLKSLQAMVQEAGDSMRQRSASA